MRAVKQISRTCTAFFFAAFFFAAASAMGNLAFPNPSLDEDADNIGSPDGWTVRDDTQVSLVTDKVSHGIKAARFDSGYDLLSCNLQADVLAGLKLRITFDAAGVDGAKIGVIIGTSRQGADGTVAFENTPLIWNRELTSDYSKIAFSYILPTNAVGTRIYFGVYRSNKQGTVWLDNFTLASGFFADLTPEQIKAINIIDRDWQYGVLRILQALERNSDDAYPPPEQTGETGMWGSLSFPNPSLEEDADNIGSPDGWTVRTNTMVSLVTDKVSHGVKAARFDSGYDLLSCNLQAGELSGLKLRITFDAAGVDGAKLGVIIGTSRQGADGTVTFENTPLIWNRELISDYSKIAFSYVLPTNAVGTRIYFGVYRSNKQGTVWLDNLTLFSGPHADLLAEWSEAQTILERTALGDATLLEEELSQKLMAVNVCVNRSLFGVQNVVAGFSAACERQEPDAIFPECPETEASLLSLANEYQAFGLLVASAIGQTQNVNVAISGGDEMLDRIEVRRQVFMMNWYQKEKALQTDPLPLLAGEERTWSLPLEPGETAKLFVSLKFKENVSGTLPLNIQVGNCVLTQNVEVLPVNLPTEPFFANFQCIYPALAPAGRHPDLVARDLAEHYTTAIEFPYLPSAFFNPDGSLAREYFANSNLSNWMHAYAEENIQMALFWQGSFTRFPVYNSTNRLPYLDASTGVLTPAWKNAYTNLLVAWLDYAEREGVPRNMFQMWCMDELASHEDFATAPGSKVLLGREIYQLTGQAAPDVKRLVTAGNYTLPADYLAFVPDVDVVLPHWPIPVELLRWAPPDFNAREAFLAESLPLLKAERELRDLTIWSYKVDSGKAESVLRMRAYPLCAIGLGFTGVGSWAYNVCSGGTTWDDTDGGLLDYILVYDGEEEHPLNQKYNVTGETVVPSIRWEAMRQGIQDAKILLYLKDRLANGTCDEPTAIEIQEILDQAEAKGRAVEFTQEWVDETSIRVRRLLGGLQGNSGGASALSSIIILGSITKGNQK